MWVKNDGLLPRRLAAGDNPRPRARRPPQPSKGGNRPAAQISNIFYSRSLQRSPSGKQSLPVPESTLRPQSLGKSSSLPVA